jgi:hypothetical protein
MSETEGLLADAKIDDGSDNQQEPESISHLQPEAAAELAPQLNQSEDNEDVTRPDWYPEKFWSDDGPDIENLVKSYNELQKKFSQGKHKTPDEYDTRIFSEANIGEDDALFTAYRAWAKENGISQDAFEALGRKFLELSSAEADQAKVSYDEEYRKLGPNADATIKSVTDWAQSLVRKGVWGEDDFDEFRIMAGTAQGMRALQKVRRYYGDQAIPINVAQPEGAPSKEELQAMVGSPEYSTNPAYRQKVEKLFEQVYGGQAQQDFF